LSSSEFAIGSISYMVHLTKAVRGERAVRGAVDAAGPVEDGGRTVPANHLLSVPAARRQPDTLLRIRFAKRASIDQ